MIKLSVLDQAPIQAGASPRRGITEALRLAQLAERLGYHRYWVAEHHNSEALGCASPEVLIPLVAARTSRLRVGSGGVLLSLYSPLKVAETFRLLETLFPGRIDLGIGRAAGGAPQTTAALTGGVQVPAFGAYDTRVEDLLSFLKGTPPNGHPFHGVEAMPAGDRLPPVWLLGSGLESAQYAARLGCAYCYAQFIHPRGGEEALALYRDTFQPSTQLPAPQASVCVMVQCAESGDEAHRLSKSRYLWVIRGRKRLGGPIPTVEEADAYPYDDAERTLLARLRRRTVAGDPTEIEERLAEMARAYAVDELSVVTICHDYEARLRSYELLAEAFELQGQPQPRVEPGA